MRRRDTYSRLAERLQSRGGGNGSIINISGGGGGGSYLPLAGGTMAGNIDMGSNNLTNVALINGYDVSAIAHARLHDILSASDHTVTGSALDVVGLTATDTLGLLTPSSAPGSASALLKSSAAGNLTLPTVTATTKVTSPTIDTASGDLSLAPNSGLTKATGKLVADGVVGTAPSNAVPADLDASLYVDGASSAGVANLGTAAWGKSGYFSFNAYQVAPRPNDGNPATAGNMKFYGGNAGSTRAFLSVFDGNAGTFKQYVSPSSYADGDGITWAELTSLTSSGNLSVVSSVRSPLLATDSGNMEISPAGDLILDPVGNDVLPELNYDINLGAINKKYLTLHAAELWVETLVAQETIATIGGRILVGPTNILETDLAPSDTTVSVKYNNFLSGDRVYMEADGKIEFFAVTSTYSGTGPYTYTITRNLDGTGANQWYAGDAMFNTGQTGNGWIDLYSLYGMNSAANVVAGTQRAGPTIVGNVRLSSTYNDFRERWAIGSLNGLYDYSSAIYGFAAGDPLATWVGLDATYGLRMMSASTKRMEITPAGALNINNSAGANVITMDGSGNSYFAGVMTIGTSGEIRQGTGSIGVDFTGLRIWRDGNIGRFAGYNSDTLQAYLEDDGKLYAGGGFLQVDENGINLQQDDNVSPDGARSISWWADIDTQTGNPTQFISAYRVGASFRNYLLLGVNPETSFDGYIVLDAGGAEVLSVISGAGIFVEGTMITDTVRPASDSTYDLGSSSIYYNNLYARNLHVDTIVGTPSYSHSHSASDITGGTFDLARIPATLTGKDADTVDGFHGSAFSLTSHTHSYLPLAGGTMTGNILFSGAQTVDGVDISAFKTAYDAHNHDSRYYTETEVDTLLAGYVPTTRQVIAGSGLTGGGALSADVTLNHADTSTVADSSNSNGVVLQSMTFDTYGHVLTRATTDLDSRYGQLGAANTWTGVNTYSQGLVVERDSSGAVVRGTIAQDSSTAAVYFTIQRSRGTISSKTAIQSGDLLGVLSFRGYGTTAFNSQGTEIRAYASESMTDSAYGSEMRFYTIAIGATSPTRVATFTNSGALLIGTTAAPGGELLRVNGAASIVGDLTIDGAGAFAEDTDSTHIFGRAVIGYATNSDAATFAHYDHSTLSNAAFTQYAGGGIRLNAAAGQSISLAIGGTNVLTVDADSLVPFSTVAVDIGDYSRQIRTLYAAEMYVQNLVAEDVRATIGGGILVAPTTKLIADLNAVAVTIDVEHNNLASGEYILLKTAPGGTPQVEAMQVTSAATVITGGYRYSVTRNLDGSGANVWYTGDAVVSLGAVAGSGYIDIASTNTVHSHIGPTLTVYSRTDTINWNDIKPVVSVGNLRSFVDYGADEFGIGLGNDLTLTPTTGFKGVTADRTNGVRLFNVGLDSYASAIKTVELDTTGNLKLGSNVTNAATTTFDFTASTGVLRLGPLAASKPNLYWDATDLKLRINTTDYIKLSATAATFEGPINLGTGGGIYQGTGTFGTPTTGLKVWNDTGVGRLATYNAGIAQVYFDTSGVLNAGGGNVKLDANGISFNEGSVNSTKLKFYNGANLVSQVYSSSGIFNIDTTGLSSTAYLKLHAQGSGGSSDGAQVLIGTIGSVPQINFNLGASIVASISSSTLTMTSLDLDMNGNDITDIGTIGETWTAPTFGTGWSDYGGGFGYQAVKYKKVGDLVFVRGMAQRTSGTATTIFTLPAGYRPSTGHEFYMCISNADTTARVRVYSTGAVAMESGDYTWVSLSGIVFSTI